MTQNSLSASVAIARVYADSYQLTLIICTHSSSFAIQSCQPMICHRTKATPSIDWRCFPLNPNICIAHRLPNSNLGEKYK